MPKIAESILRGALEALAFAEGKADPQNYRIHIPPEIDVKRIRTNFELDPKPRRSPSHRSK